MRVADFERLLVDRGLVDSGATPLPFGAAGRPWYVSLVLGGAGWLASLFALLFVFLLFDLDTPLSAAVAGGVMLAAGFGLYVADRDNAFFEQLALSLSLAGQVALIVAVGEASDSATATAGFTAVLSVAVVWTVPNAFAKTLSTFFACVAWALTVRFGWWGEGWLDESVRSVRLAPALIGWLVIWAPVAFGTELLIQREVRWMAAEARRVARPALTGLLLALAAGTWASEPFAVLGLRSPAIEGSPNWLALWPLLGVAAALFAALCAFRLRHWPMIGFAIAGALIHTVQFYYLLGVDLVTKSYVMLAVGVALLLTSRALRTRPPAPAASTSGGSEAP